MQRLPVLAGGQVQRLSSAGRVPPTPRSWKVKMKELGRKSILWLDLDEECIRLLSEDRTTVMRTVPLRQVATVYMGKEGVLFKWNLGNGVQSDVFKTKHAAAILAEVRAIWQILLKRHEEQQQLAKTKPVAPP